ncbi:ArnT family glycosyltransferase [Qipengyuania flava]|uniref:ArnT family glycosyltransferase n=1 Tax=Qipengyuania flava TaxID=192812 RepID=UPI001C63A630|nr:glycosyltransferase family 39 protein [Qipengyuania flava]QYJ06614.1 glycosyltransferase family 39 protein [Qipengyuania flava]
MATAAIDRVEIPAKARPARADWIACAVIALAVFVIRSPWIGDSNADIDEQLYSLIGNAMLEGQLPFVDLWDRKPFGLFALFAGAHAIGGPGPEAYQVLAALFTAAGAIMIYVLARTLVDRATAAGAGLLYAMLMTTYGSHSGNSEGFFVPLMIAMALLVRDPAHPKAVARALLSMLIGGLALQIKYTAVPQCLFFGLWALWGQFRRGASPARLVQLAAAFGALGLLPTVMVGASYALAGHWDAFLFANFTSFFDREASDAGRLYSDLALFLMPLAALAVGGLYAALRMGTLRDAKTYLFIALWLLASLATVFLPSTVYRYYFAAAVPATVLFALPLLDRRGPARFAPLALVLAGSFYILYLPRQYEQSAEQRAAMDRLTSAIAPHVDGEDACLWIYDGPTSLYRLTGSCLPTRFIYPDHLNNALERHALGIVQEGEVARLLATRPPVIVTADTEFTPQNEDAGALVKEALAAGYREIANETLHEREIRAWKRID